MITVQRKQAILLTILCLSFTVASVSAQTLYRVKIQPGVSVKMRDGVSLIADIYSPVSDEKFPVLLTRTPYNRTGDPRLAAAAPRHAVDARPRAEGDVAAERAGAGPAIQAC